MKVKASYFLLVVYHPEKEKSDIIVIGLFTKSRYTCLFVAMVTTADLSPE